MTDSKNPEKRDDVVEIATTDSKNPEKRDDVVEIATTDSKTPKKWHDIAPDVGTMFKNYAAFHGALAEGEKPESGVVYCSTVHGEGTEKPTIEYRFIDKLGNLVTAGYQIQGEDTKLVAETVALLKDAHGKLTWDTDMGEAVVDNLKASFLHAKADNHKVGSYVPKISKPFMAVKGDHDLKAVYGNYIDEFTQKIGQARKDWRDNVVERMKLNKDAGDIKVLSEVFKEAYPENQRKAFLNTMVALHEFDTEGFQLEDEFRLVKMEALPDLLKIEIDKLKKYDTGTKGTTIADNIEKLEEAHKALKSWVDFAKEPEMWYEKGFDGVMNHGFTAGMVLLAGGALTGIGYGIAAAVAAAGAGGGIAIAWPVVGAVIGATAGAALLGFAAYGIYKAYQWLSVEENRQKIKDSDTYKAIMGVFKSIGDAISALPNQIKTFVQHVWFEAGGFRQGGQGIGNNTLNAEDLKDLRGSIKDAIEHIESSNQLFEQIFGSEVDPNPCAVERKFYDELDESDSEKLTGGKPKDIRESLRCIYEHKDEDVSNKAGSPRFHFDFSTDEGRALFSDAKGTLQSLTQDIISDLHKVEREMIKSQDGLNSHSVDELNNLHRHLQRHHEELKVIQTGIDKESRRLSWIKCQERASKNYQDFKQGAKDVGAKILQGLSDAKESTGKSLGDLYKQAMDKLGEKGEIVSKTHTDAQDIIANLRVILEESNQATLGLTPEYTIELETTLKEAEKMIDPMHMDEPISDKLDAKLVEAVEQHNGLMARVLNEDEAKLTEKRLKEDEIEAMSDEASHDLEQALSGQSGMDNIVSTAISVAGYGALATALYFGGSELLNQLVESASADLFELGAHGFGM